MNHARRILGGTMFLVVCSAVAALACRDIDRPLEASGPPVSREQQGPLAVAALTCELDGVAKTVVCAMPAKAPAGVSASVIYGATATYAILFPYNLVKDTAAHTWQFTAYVQNLLKQKIGTLNGTSVTGVKVFVTDFHATTGTGTVSVANADGTGNFTAPNQPYFNYNQIVAPSGYTGNKVWRFNVPNAVAAVSMTILISTDFPAEQGVALTPPNTRPAFIDTLTHGAFVPHLVSVIFKPTATLADRQLAIAYVGGSLAGGAPLAIGEGFYHLTVPDSGQGVQLDTAIARLGRLPQVAAASRLPLLKGQYLNPRDGTTWRHWSLSPDTIGTENNWALEQIDAPFAWGCSTGSPTTEIAVIDHPFDQTEAIINAIAPLPTLNGFTAEAVRHGTWVSGVLAANGNDDNGITGIMWRAGMHLDDLGANPTLDRVSQFISAAAVANIPIVNLSWGYDWPGQTGNPSWTPNLADSSTELNLNRMFATSLSATIHSSSMPLVVIAAGDHPVDAFGRSPRHSQIRPPITYSL